MRRYRIDPRDGRRQRLLIAALLAALAGAAFLMLHAVATMDPQQDAAKGRGDRTDPQAGKALAAVPGIESSGLVLAINLVLTGIFAASCCRWTWRWAPKPLEADVSGRGAGGIG